MSIRIDRVTKRFGAQLVLDHVSLEVGEGERFVLLGASGSGKSTLLRVVAGLARPDAGRIVMSGRDVTMLRPQHRGTGFVFQNYSVFRHMTVGQNIEFGLRLRGVPRAERERRRDELLELVGLPGLAWREASRLSGGQQQRVAIARALAYQPQVLLLDEPFGALDVKIRTQLRRSLRAIQERLRITTLLVTHDQDEAFELADRVGLMDRGRMVEVGASEALYARPRTLFAATFLGTGTVVTGRVSAGRARFPGLDLALPAPAPLAEGAEAHLLVRPEDVALSAEPDDERPALGPCAVIEQTFAGPVRRVRLALRRRAEVHPGSSPPPGAAGLALDALLPAHVTPPSGDAWVGLRRWHFLDSPPASVLVADDGYGPLDALRAAGAVARPLGARVTVLGVTRDARHAEGLGLRVRRRVGRAGLADVDLRVRYGAVAAQLLQEQADLLSQAIVVAPRPPRFAWLRRRFSREALRLRVGRTLLALLEGTRAPVLIATAPPAAPRRPAVLALDPGATADLLREAERIAGPLAGGGELLAIGDEALGVDVPAGWRSRRIAAGDPGRLRRELLEGGADLLVLPLVRRGPHVVNVLPPLVQELLAHLDRPALLVPTLQFGPEPFA